jgi:hypothetical protein
MRSVVFLTVLHKIISLETIADDGGEDECDCDDDDDDDDDDGDDDESVDQKGDSPYEDAL